MPEKTLGIDRITPTLLAGYDKCPKSFYYAQWLGLKLPTPVVHFKFGEAIHAALNEIYNQREGENWNAGASIDKAFQKFNEIFTIDAIENKNEVERTQKYIEMSADGIAMIQEFWNDKESIKTRYGINPIGYEQLMTQTLWHPQTKEEIEVPLRYKMDYFLPDNNILEIKTSAAPYDIFETRASLQAQAYSWAMWCKTGVFPTIHYLVLIKKRKKNKIQHLEFKYDMSEMLAFDSKVRSILQKIKNREFERPSHGHPYFCECTKFDAALNINI